MLCPKTKTDDLARFFRDTAADSFGCFSRRLEETNNEGNTYIMDDDDILHIEAQEILRQASSEMLELTALQEIDLNRLALWELRVREARRQDQRGAHISALVREFLR